MLFKIK